MESIGEKIKEVRKNLKLSQQQLGGDNFTKSYISQIERGIINPSVKALEVLADRLNKPLSYFMGDDNKDIDAVYLLFKAQRLFDEKKYEDSLEIYNSLLPFVAKDKDFDVVGLYLNIANIYFNLKSYNLSLEYCNKILDINIAKDIYIFKTYLLLGKLYVKLDNKNKSLETLLKAKSFNDEHKINIKGSIKLKLFKDIGILYNQLNNISLSIEYFNKAIDISKGEHIVTTDVLETLKVLCDLYWMKKERQRSIEYLDELLPLCKYFNKYETLPSIYSKYSIIHFDKGNLQLANEYLDKQYNALSYINDKMLKSEGLAYYNLYSGKLLKEEGHIDMAQVKILDSLNEINVDNPSIEILQSKGIILLSISKFYFDIEKPNEALKHSLKAEEILTGTQLTAFLPEVYQLMAKIYMKLGRLEIAQKCYDEAYNLLNNK